MTKQELYDLTDAYKAELVARGAAESLATFKTAMSDCAAELKTTGSSPEDFPYDDDSWWTAVEDKMEEYGQVYGTDSDEDAIQDLAADLSFPTAHATQELLVAFMAESLPIYFETFGNDGIQTLIEETAKTTGQTETSPTVIIPETAKVLQLQAKLSSCTDASVSLQMAESLDDTAYTDYDEFDVRTLAGTYPVIVDVTNRMKFMKFKFAVTGAATVELKAVVR